VTLVLNLSLNRQACVTICGIPAKKKMYKKIASHFAVFLAQGSFESPLWVPDGCEIPNMRPVFIYLSFAWKTKFLRIPRLSCAIRHQDFSGFMAVPQISLGTAHGALKR